MNASALRTISLLCIGITSCLRLAAAPVDSAEAVTLGCEFLATHGARASTAKIRTEAKAVRMGNAYEVSRAGRFVLVAADDALPAIVGYGTTGQASAAMPPALQALLRGAGSRFATQPAPISETPAPIAPMLTTTRHQKAPYNNLCPIYHYSDGTPYPRPCVVGCVATAMEQIVTYHRPVVTLLDTLHGWTAESYSTTDALPGETVDTRLILDNYDTAAASPEATDAVARLSYWLGLAARMQYGFDSSGAYSSDLVRPLRHAFGFPYVHHLEARLYDPSEYWRFIVAELAAGRPVYYAGAIMGTGGHAFVLDGLDADGLVHVNWGYGGDFDGYFRLDVLCHTQPADERRDTPVDYGFFADQECIAVSPYAVTDAVVPDTLVRTPSDVAIDGIECQQPPATGRLTAVSIRVRNTSATQAFNSTFGILSNAPTDTALVAQAEWLGLTACKLQPLEERTLTIHATFTHSGSRLLSVTPDGVHCSTPHPVEVTETEAPVIGLSTPEVSILSPTGIEVAAHYTNPSATERAATDFSYDLLDNDTQASATKLSRIYLPALADSTDRVRFTSLTPGHTYTLRLRRHWPIAESVTFTLPTADGITPVTTATAPSEWYTTDGRRLPARPLRPGIYIRKAGARTGKIIVNACGAGAPTPAK